MAGDPLWLVAPQGWWHGWALVEVILKVLLLFSRTVLRWGNNISQYGLYFRKEECVTTGTADRVFVQLTL